MYRRDFLVRAGLCIGAATLSAAYRDLGAATISAQQQFADWAAVRKQFNLAPGLIHMSSFFLASHPKLVRDQIEEHRRAFDANPIEYYFANEMTAEAKVAAAAAHYLGVDAADIALTDSTTMGLGLLYSGLKLQAGQEILTTTHDHYSTETSLRLRSERTGASLRRVTLYDDPSKATTQEMTDRLAREIRPNTRIIAVTWVHSSSGIKLPLRMMSEAIAKANANRAEQDRALLCVDGVHGLGIENVTLPELGCDFFIAGTHKWMFGPRGTGLVWGKPQAWPVASATIPTFDGVTYEMWMETRPKQEVPIGAIMSPGGFHSFEHRWSVHKAFEFHEAIGKPRVQDRVHSLNRQLKEGLQQTKGVKLYTPMDEPISAGIVCFDVEGIKPDDVVAKLRSRGIVGSVTPYKTLYARLAPSLLTSSDDVEQTLREVRTLAG